MPDVFSVAKRSLVMAAIRSRGNRSTELTLAAALRLAGMKGWRRHYPIPGKPDFVFRQQKVAIFVDGCFWHGCPRCGTVPKGNRAYWAGKISRNRERDRQQTRVLRARGWRVLRIWEHALRRKALASTMRRIEAALAKETAGRGRGHP